MYYKIDTTNSISSDYDKIYLKKMDKIGYKTIHNIIDSSTQLYLCQKNTQLYLIMKKRTLIMKK